MRKGVCVLSCGIAYKKCDVKRNIKDIPIVMPALLLKGTETKSNQL